MTIAKADERKSIPVFSAEETSAALQFKELIPAIRDAFLKEAQVPLVTTTISLRMMAPRLRCSGRLLGNRMPVSWASKSSPFSNIQAVGPGLSDLAAGALALKNLAVS